MGRVALSIVLGLFAPVVAFMAAAMVEIPGQNPIQEPIAAAIAAAVYLGICEFLLAPRGSHTLALRWLAMAGLGAPLLVSAFLLEDPILRYGPIVIAGWVGILAGAMVAGRVAISGVSLDRCRITLRASATLLVTVAVVVAAGAIPLTKRAGTFPDGTPGQAVTGFWVIAVCSLLIAASLAFIAVLAGRGRRPWPAVLGLLAFVAFVIACTLVPGAFKFPGHGSIMLAAGILLFLCLVAELVVAALVATTALRLTVTEPARSAGAKSAEPRREPRL